MSEHRAIHATSVAGWDTVELMSPTNHVWLVSEVPAPSEYILTQPLETTGADKDIKDILGDE